MSEHDPQPDREGFGEASLGEAQSENPPSDPEMIEDEEEGADAPGESRGEESYGGDPDSGPAFDPRQADGERDQAEG